MTDNSYQVKRLLDEVVGRDEVIIKNVTYKVVEIRKADAGFPYAKIKILSPEHKVYFLEFYWIENKYQGIALSKTIHEYEDFDIAYFHPPQTLVWREHVCSLADSGKAKITHAGESQKYADNDIIHYWEYASPHMSYRISLGFNERTQKWMNNCAEKLNFKDVKAVIK